MYEVDATAAPAFAFYAIGYDRLEPGPAGSLGRWQFLQRAVIDVFSTKALAAATLRFECTSRTAARELRLSGDAADLGSWTVPADRMLSIAVRLAPEAGVTRLFMEATPGPEVVPDRAPEAVFCTLMQVDA